MAGRISLALDADPEICALAPAQDDVFVTLPTIEAQLTAIPAPNASFAYYGHPGFFSLLQTNHSMTPRGYAPNHPYALMMRRVQRLREDCDPRRGCELIGPFPYMCGQLFALGAGLARALLAHPAFSDAERRVARLPDTNPLLTEDVWLGAAIELASRRPHVVAPTADGASSSATAAHSSTLLPTLLPPVAHFSLGGRRDLFLDPTDYSLTVPATVAVFHNRNMNPAPADVWHLRMPTLYAFVTRVERCAAALAGSVRWHGGQRSDRTFHLARPRPSSGQWHRRTEGCPSAPGSAAESPPVRTLRPAARAAGRRSTVPPRRAVTPLYDLLHPGTLLALDVNVSHRLHPQWL